MSATNTPQLYGSVSKTFHWLTAALILTLIPLGIYANDLPYDSSEALAYKAWFFSLHKTLGVAVFFVALARIVWALSQPKPAPLHPDRKLETFAAATVHWLLYGSLVIVPLSGWIHHASTAGFAPIWWPLGQDLPLVPKSESLAATTAGLHIVFERVLAVSIFLHLAGALKHHFVDRDATLRRMLPGHAETATTDTPGHKTRPILAALAVWAVAVGIGALLGTYEKHDTGVQAAALEAVQSDWAVQEGTLEITVSQLGAPVTGSFADWTAAIRFDETRDSGTVGSVDVVISIGSLTLGSVTREALGADFFNVEGFPTANFNAEILRDATGYAAVGTLTIKDESLPLTLPFTLDVNEGLAVMEAQTQIDRRHYKIGASQTDPASLGFNVDVSIQLTAQDESQSSRGAQGGT
ncbi:MAG: cytochrome b/b6 domain-containing protein [Roseobacter sp.]|jgi:cytochrome b561/polyisoprenoid-binding protein YceI|nr:cytochrome b/b6 domain-containing protein [Roseobacter sp.]